MEQKLLTSCGYNPFTLGLCNDWLYDSEQPRNLMTIDLPNHPRRWRGCLSTTHEYLCQVICAEDSLSLICGFSLNQGRRPFHPWIPSLNSIFVIVQSLSHVWFFMTPWTAAHQGPLSSTISQSLLKLMSIESVMLSSHVILCCPLLLLPSIFPTIQGFSNDLALHIRWTNIGAAAWASVLRMHSQCWSSLGLTGLISLLFKGLSGVFPSITVQRYQFFDALPSQSSSHSQL